MKNKKANLLWEKKSLVVIYLFIYWTIQITIAVIHIDDYSNKDTNSSFCSQVLDLHLNDII